MASVMQPLLIAALPEILHVDMKPNYQHSSMSATTAASSRSASASGSEDVPNRAHRRFRTVGGTDAIELDAEYPSGLVARDPDDSAPIRRSKTSPAFDDKGLTNVYPTELVVRNTFLEFVEEPAFLQMRRVKSAPSSPAVARGATLAPPAPKAAGVVALAPPAPKELELARMVSTSPKLGGRKVPTVGSAKHHLGECKPCAFFWKPAGCSNGVNCVYCHLCDANEKKRRQKEKKAFFKGQN